MFAKTLCVALLSISLSAFMAQGAPTADEVALRAHFAPRAQEDKGKGKTTATTSKAATAAASASAAGKAAATTSAAGKDDASAAASSSAAAATGKAAATSSAAAAANTTAAGNNGNPQTSLTLDPSVIASGFANDGQDVPTVGQVASLTSTNNYINFCIGQTITNGKQITTGSCNPAPMGTIPSKDKMPSCKFTSPLNLDTIKANTPFTIKMKIQGMEAGNFVNANSNYFSAPQQTNSGGLIQGHSHVVVQLLDSLKAANPLDPTVFAFFKGLNAKPDGNGLLTADVTNGLPSGTYRLSSINTAANHQPVLVPVAQHGSLDDAVYFSVTDDGQPAAGDNAAAGAANQTSTATATGGAGAASTNQAGASASGAVATGTGSAAAASSSAKAASAKAPVPTKKSRRRKGHKGRKPKA